MSGIGELLCAGCSVAMIYAGPLTLTLPQGAQTAITFVDAERRPVAVDIALAGSSAVAVTLAGGESGSKTIVITAQGIGQADVVILTKAADQMPIALSVTVEAARPRKESDGPLTLELVLASLDESEQIPTDDIVPMLAGFDMPGWTRGERMVGYKPYLHWTGGPGGGKERARMPAGWWVIFPATANRLAHGPDAALWEGPAGLGQWQWHTPDGRERLAGQFEEQDPVLRPDWPQDRRRQGPRRALREPVPAPIMAAEQR